MSCGSLTYTFQDLFIGYEMSNVTAVVLLLQQSGFEIWSMRIWLALQCWSDFGKFLEILLLALFSLLLTFGFESFVLVFW